MSGIRLDNKADTALSKLQNTVLTPMDEALFQAWAKANQIKKPDLPGDVVDYRGIYKVSGGEILPNGELKRIADRINDQHTLENALHTRMQDRIAATKQKYTQHLDQAAQTRDDATQQIDPLPEKP